MGAPTIYDDGVTGPELDDDIDANEFHAWCDRAGFDPADDYSLDAYTEHLIEQMRDEAEEARAEARAEALAERGQW